MIYALVNSNLVVNVANGSQEWAHAVAPNYQFVVDITDVELEPTVGWSYNGVQFSPPTVSLSQAKTTKISELKSDINAYIDSYYDMDTRLKFLTIYTSAYVNGLTHRREYIEPLHSWGSSIIAFGATLSKTIQGMTTVPDVQNVRWNILETVGVGPSLSLAVAVSIQD